MKIKTAGSVCTGIGSALHSWDFIDFKWVAEIEEFQSNVLKEHYPHIRNYGDLVNIKRGLQKREIEGVDLFCGGTPCQPFSLAGLKKGLSDDRGNITLDFIKIADLNDKIREGEGKDRAIVVWENVLGVISDKTKAFNTFLWGLAGKDEEYTGEKLGRYGYIEGDKRNVAWRVLDAKYFGVPQQRRRVFVVATDRKYDPRRILFENSAVREQEFNNNELLYTKDGTDYEFFREYTDTLYSAYGTKWNGNSAAYNGSLFVVEDGRLRRFTPLECERLMGFPDNYTNIKGASRTRRYQAIGNSWAVPVVGWIGDRIKNYATSSVFSNTVNQPENTGATYKSSLIDIVEPCDIKNLFLSPVATAGITRRAKERRIKMNPRLEEYMLKRSGDMSQEKIEGISKQQKRGNFSRKQKTNN